MFLLCVLFWFLEIPLPSSIFWFYFLMGNRVHTVGLECVYIITYMGFESKNNLCSCYTLCSVARKKHNCA